MTTPQPTHRLTPTMTVFLMNELVREYAQGIKHQDAVIKETLTYSGTDDPYNEGWKKALQDSLETITAVANDEALITGITREEADKWYMNALNANDLQALADLDQNESAIKTSLISQIANTATGHLALTDEDQRVGYMDALNINHTLAEIEPTLITHLKNGEQIESTSKYDRNAQLIQKKQKETAPSTPTTPTAVESALIKWLRKHFT